MSDHQYRGPAVTYVTDEDLDRDSHQRVLSEFISCAAVHPIRVALRLPRWSDTEFRRLLEWYLEQAEILPATSSLERALVHDRPEVTNLFPQVSLWLPWRNRDLVRESDIGNVTISIHSVEDAHEAIAAGASELVFGHVFTSESHPGEPGRGIVALQEVAEAIQGYEHPPRLTAIGGVDERTIPEIGRIRHQRIAAMRSISRSDDIARTLDHIRTNWVAARINADLDEGQSSPLGNPSSLFF